MQPHVYAGHPDSPAPVDDAGKANAGIGFAIPIDTAKGLVEQILQYGRVMRPSLGVVIAPPQALQRSAFKGVLVLDVSNKSVGARRFAIVAKQPCVRARAKQFAPLTGTKYLHCSKAPVATRLPPCDPNLTPQCTVLPAAVPHAQVTPGSPAEQVGLRPTRRNAAGELILGDIIQGVDGSPVRSPKDLLEALDTKRVGDKIVMDIVRGGTRVQVTAQLAERKLGMGTE